MAVSHVEFFVEESSAEAALQRLIPKIHLGGLEKIRAARDISEHMAPGANTSPSFGVFRDGLLSL